MASPFPAHGLTADVYQHSPGKAPKGKDHKTWAVVAVLLGFGTVLLCQLAPGVCEGDSASAQETSAEQTYKTYELEVHTLNHTSRSTNGTATVFTFDASQLPFDFASLLFDEFRGDSEYCSRYYAGLSMLVWTDGPDATLSFLENDGKQIEDIAYLGQSLVVLNGWESISKDVGGRVISHTWGSMQIAAYDWRDCCWSPEQGIAVEHPEDVTISQAALCLMVYEPANTTEIPEMGPVLACLVLCIVVVISRRFRA